jgi:hypothetical protein
LAANCAYTPLLASEPKRFSRPFALRIVNSYQIDLDLSITKPEKSSAENLRLGGGRRKRSSLATFRPFRPLLIGGVIKSVYDILLLIEYHDVRPP